MWLFTWSGSKLFQYIYVYAPEAKGQCHGAERDQDKVVRAMHFGIDEESIIVSAAEILETANKDQ